MYGYGLGNFGMMDPYAMSGMYGLGGGQYGANYGNNYTTPMYASQYQPAQEVDSYEPSHRPSVVGEVVKLGAVAAAAVGVTLLVKGKGGETKKIIKEAEEEIETVIKKTKTNILTKWKEKRVARKEEREFNKAVEAEQRELAAKAAEAKKKQGIGNIISGLQQNAPKVQAEKKEAVSGILGGLLQKEGAVEEKVLTGTVIAPPEKKRSFLGKLADKFSRKPKAKAETPATTAEAPAAKAVAATTKPVAETVQSVTQEAKTKKKLFGGLFDWFSKENRIARQEARAAKKVSNKDLVIEPKVNEETAAPAITTNETINRQENVNNFLKNNPILENELKQSLPGLYNPAAAVATQAETAVVKKPNYIQRKIDEIKANRASKKAYKEIMNSVKAAREAAVKNVTTEKPAQTVEPIVKAESKKGFFSGLKEKGRNFIDELKAKFERKPKFKLESPKEVISEPNVLTTATKNGNNPFQVAPERTVGKLNPEKFATVQKEVDEIIQNATEKSELETLQKQIDALHNREQRRALQNKLNSRLNELQ